MEKIVMKSNTYKEYRCCSFSFIGSLFIIISLTAVIALLYFDPVCAEQTATVKTRITHKRVSGHSLSAPDENGHVIAIGQRAGEVDFDGKETAKYESTGMVDAWAGRKGIYKGYSKYTFKDGSEIFFSWTANGTRNKDGLPSQQGSGTILKGTGRFEGIRGQAVFSTTQLKPASEDPARNSVANAVIIYTLP